MKILHVGGLRRMAVVKNKVTRHALFASGVVCVALGSVGVVLPLLPTTPFLLLAAWCFFKSSPKAYAWLYKQPLLGPALKDWERRGAISRRTKVIALSMIAVSLLFMWIRVPFLWLKISVNALLVLISLFIVSRPEK